MTDPNTLEARDDFTAAVALVRAGMAGDEAGMRALLDTRDVGELVSLTLATAALAQLLGLLSHHGDTTALDAQLVAVLANMAQH